MPIESVEKANSWRLIYVIVAVGAVLALLMLSTSRPGPSKYKTYCVGHTMIIAGVNSVAAVPASADCPVK